MTDPTTLFAHKVKFEPQHPPHITEIVYVPPSQILEIHIMEHLASRVPTLFLYTDVPKDIAMTLASSEAKIEYYKEHIEGQYDEPSCNEPLLI